MSPDVEMRELRVFLTLAEELHFGRTAERLGLTPSRISQIVRRLERRLGSELVYRTSRHVELTALGERFRQDVGAAYAQISVVVERTAEATRTPRRVLRIGLFSEPTGRAVVPVAKAFEIHHPDCAVQIAENPLDDMFGPLYRDEIDLMVTWVPHGQSGIVTGPTLARLPRVLAVSRDHPLARRAGVSIEDLADHRVPRLTGPPKELQDVWIPERTPQGRDIPRIDVNERAARDRGWLLTELTYLVAVGKAVHPTVANVFADPTIEYVPIRDLPPMRCALVWRRGRGDPTTRTFIRTARDVLSGGAQEP